MIERTLLAIAIATALPVPAGAAESVTLKTGEVIEGKIIYQSEREVAIDVQFSATITDRRTIPMSEVATVKQLKPDQQAWEKIQAMPMPSSAADPGIYTRVIENDLKPFLVTYPYSKNVPAAQARIQMYEAERERIISGEVKMDDVWLSASDYAKEKYQVDARAILDTMQNEMAAKRWTEALNAFDILYKDYPYSIAFVESIPSAKKAASSMEQQLTYDLRNLSATLAQRKQTLELASRDQRPRVEAAMKADEARAAAAPAQANASGKRFYPIYNFDEKSLRDQLASTKAVAQSIDKLDQSTLERGASLVKRAKREISEKNYAAAAATLTALTETWKNYEGLGRLKDRAEQGQAAVDSASQHQADTLENQRHLKSMEDEEAQED